MQNEQTTPTCSLAKLFSGLIQLETSVANTMITGLSLDSRYLNAGDLFFAIQGLREHGLKYSDLVISKGAAAIAWEPTGKFVDKTFPNTIPCFPVPDLPRYISHVAQRFYHNPSKRLKVIGVTGTDGKTSVSHFIAQALSNLNIGCGVIGTLGYGAYPNLEDASHTTPDALRVQNLLYQFSQENLPFTVIEASSHGLKQGRLDGVEFDTAVFTNLGRDHMDYHASIHEYGESKKLLFSTSELRNAVVNVDDDFGKKISEEFCKKLNLVAYSIDNQEPKFENYIFAKEIIAEKNKTTIKVCSSWGDADLQTTLYGRFNVGNLLAVMGVLLVSGYLFEDVIRVLSSLQTVPGRMDLINKDHDSPTVVIDYAHTPQALENALKVLREQSSGKLWCVFGCGGDRDKGKRVLMARVVEEHADFAVITDDNPRSEDASQITQDIVNGFLRLEDYSLIHDRNEAIKYAIHHAAKEDTILIAGKGHETVQIINNNKFPFDDKKIAASHLESFQ